MGRWRIVMGMALALAFSPALAADEKPLTPAEQRVQQLMDEAVKAFNARDLRGVISKTETLRHEVMLPTEIIILAARAAAVDGQMLLAKHLYDEYFFRAGKDDKLYATATTDRDAVAPAAEAELRLEMDSALAGETGKLERPRSDPNNPPVQPDYPADLRAAGTGGRVVLDLFIGRNGRVYDASVKQSSGVEGLDKSALVTALSAWRFVPGTNGGKPLAMWVPFAANFQADNPPRAEDRKK